jgi:hypothetical protein
MQPMSASEIEALKVELAKIEAARDDVVKAAEVQRIKNSTKLFELQEQVSTAKTLGKGLSPPRAFSPKKARGSPGSPDSLSSTVTTGRYKQAEKRALDKQVLRAFL